MADPVPAKKRARKAVPAGAPTMTSPVAIVAMPAPVAVPPVEITNTEAPVDAAPQPVMSPPAEPVVAAVAEPAPSGALASAPDIEPAPEPLAAEAVDAVAPETDPAPAPVEAAPQPEVPAVAAVVPQAVAKPFDPSRLVAEPVAKGLHIMATSFDTTNATDKAKAIFGDFNDRAKSAMEKSAKFGEEVTEFTKGNVEAFVASGRVAAKGAETMAQDVAETMKKNFETATAQMKSIAAVKSPTELFQLQSDYAKSAFDSAVADASKFSESMMKLMGDIVQPLSSRYAVATEKFKAAAL